MTPAARSVCYFGFYLYATGLTLMIVPNMFLKTFQLPETSEVWIRIVGLLAFCLGFYYHRTGVQNNTAFFRLTIPARIFACIGFTAFVLLDYAPPVLAVFGVIDLLAAAWTWVALKK